MLRDQKLATGTVENRMTSLHFFFKKVLKRYRFMCQGDATQMGIDKPLHLSGQRIF